MKANQMHQVVEFNHAEVYMAKDGEQSSAKRSQRLSLIRDSTTPISLKKMQPSPVGKQMNVFKTTAQGIIQSERDYSQRGSVKYNSITPQKQDENIELKSLGRMRGSLPSQTTKNLDYSQPEITILTRCLSPPAAGTNNRLTQSAIKQLMTSQLEKHKPSQPQSEPPGLYFASVVESNILVQSGLNSIKLSQRSRTEDQHYQSMPTKVLGGSDRQLHQKQSTTNSQGYIRDSLVQIESNAACNPFTYFSAQANKIQNMAPHQAILVTPQLGQGIQMSPSPQTLQQKTLQQQQKMLTAISKKDSIEQFVLDIEKMESAAQGKMQNKVPKQVSVTPKAPNFDNVEQLLRRNSKKLLKTADKGGEEKQGSLQKPPGYFDQRISDIDYAINVDEQLKQINSELLSSKVSPKVLDSIQTYGLKRGTHNFDMPMSATASSSLVKIPSGLVLVSKLNSQDERATVKQAKDAIADGSFSKHGNLRSFSSHLQNGIDDAYKRRQNDSIKFQDSLVGGNFTGQVSTGMQRIQSFDAIAENNIRRSFANNSAKQIYDSNRFKEDSLIEEEISFEELSSKLGNLKTNFISYEEGATDRRTFNVVVEGQGPFGDLSSSVHISAQSQSNSANHESKNQSLEFKNLPALLQIADRGGSAMQGYEENEIQDDQMEDCRPRFDYNLRQYSHFNVNKINVETQIGATKGSFVDNGVGDKGGRALNDYTSEKQGDLWTRMRQGESDKHLERHLGIQPDGQSVSVSPVRAMEQQNQMLINLETPIERTDLYDDFDIHHEMIQDVSFQNGFVYAREEAKSVEYLPTSKSEIGSGRELIPETGIEQKYHTRQKSTIDFPQASHGYPKTYDLTKDFSDDLGDRLTRILNNAVPGSIIKLPATEIEVSTIILRKHFKIQGQPGTSLFFKASTLIIDFSLESEQKDERDFRHVQPVIFSETQFNFSIDLRAIAYKKYQGTKNFGNSHNSKSSKQAPIPLQNQSRTLVQLIQLKSGSKVEFRDCSFRCAKVYHQQKMKPGLSNGGVQSSKVRNRTDRSQRQDYHQKRVINHTQQENTIQLRQDSISARLSEKNLNDSQSMNQTSGRILGKYFANEIEEEQVLRDNVHEVCFWMNAEAMSEHPSCVHEFSKNSVAQRFSSQRNGSVKRPYQGSLLLQSCVLTGFYNQIRAGCNATIELDKCYMQESMSSALMLVNPCYLRMVDSNLIRTKINSGVNIHWLSDSIDKHISRVIDIQQNDIGLNNCCGIEIIGNVYAAHNLKIDISKNFIYRNKKEGLLVSNFAATAMLFYGNEFSKNEGDNLKISQVHHKANKRNCFRVENCQIEYSKGGFGANLFDTSFTIKNCIVKGNQSGGIFCSCPEKPTGIQNDAIWFLKKFPMSVKVSSCEVSQNMHYGILIQDFWKGSVIIKSSLIQSNCNFGIYIHAKEPPIKEKLNVHPSLNCNVQSLEKGINEDFSAAFFKNPGTLNTGTLQMRRQTLQVSPSQYTNISQHSNGTHIRQNPLFKRRMTMQNILGSLQSASSQQNLKMSTINQYGLDKQDNKHNLINLHRVQPPTVGEIDSNFVDSKFTPRMTPKNDQINDQQQQQLTHRGDEMEDDVDAPITTTRGLMQHSQSEIGQFKAQRALFRNNSAVPMTENMLDSRDKQSPMQMKQHNNNMSFGSSIIASLRRKVSNKVDSSKQINGQINLLSCHEQDADNAKIGKHIAAQIMHQVDLRCILEKQELGKVYIIGGTGIIQNGGAGVAVRHCYLEIDSHAKTRVQDNDFAYQVYVMLKQCQPLLTGFEKAINDHRIRGRKVLVGGGWGQITPQIPQRCCGGFLKLAAICFKGSHHGKSNNKVMDATGTQFTGQQTNMQIYAGMQSPDKLPRKTQDQMRATVETPDIARGDTAEVIGGAGKRGTPNNGRSDAREAMPRQERDYGGETLKKCTIF